MSSELRRIWRDSRIYGLGVLLNRVAGLLLIPVVLHVLPAEDWGVYMLILAVTGFIAVPAIAVIDTMVRLYFEDGDEGRRKRVVSTVMALFAAMALGFAVAAVPLTELLGALVFGHQDYRSVLLMGLSAMVFDLLLGIVLDYFRIQKWPVVFVAATLLRGVGQFALTVLFVVALELGVMGVMLGNLLAVAAVALPTAGAILWRVGWGVDRGIVGEVLTLGLPLVPAWLSKSAGPLVERQILNLLSGAGSVGIFALGARLSEQLGVLMQGPFADVWGVRLMEAASQPEKPREFNRIFLYFLIALTAAALGLALMAPELVRLLSAPDYWPAMTIVPLLALAQIAVAINYHFEVCLLQAKESRYLAVINCSTLMVSAGLLYGLTVRFGLAGAAAGVVLTQLYRLAASLYFAARCSRYVERFPWRSAAWLLALAVCAYLTALALGGQVVSPALILFKAALFGAFLLAAYLSPALSPEERNRIRAYCQAWLATGLRRPG